MNFLNSQEWFIGSPRNLGQFQTYLEKKVNEIIPNNILLSCLMVNKEDPLAVEGSGGRKSQPDIMWGVKLGVSI